VTEQTFERVAAVAFISVVVAIVGSLIVLIVSDGLDSRRCWNAGYRAHWRDGGVLLCAYPRPDLKQQGWVVAP
jgi:hypothetical protein